MLTIIVNKTSTTTTNQYNLIKGKTVFSEIRNKNVVKSAIVITVTNQLAINIFYLKTICKNNNCSAKSNGAQV